MPLMKCKKATWHWALDEEMGDKGIFILKCRSGYERKINIE